MTELAWLDGRLLPVAEAVLDLRHARALIAGRGVYETMRVEHSMVLRFDAHMQRLTQGALRLGLDKPKDGDLSAAVEAVVRANSLPAARVRLDLLLAAGGHTSALISASPLAPLPAAQSLCTVPWRRNERSPLAGIKYSACPENTIAQEDARKAGCDEALFLNTRGEVCEGAFSNLFAVLASIVTTPPLDSGCLPGIMREAVLSYCRTAGIPCQERTILTEELLTPQCTEVFLTSSIRGVMPVNRLDARAFSIVGPVTARVQKLPGL